MNNAVFERNYGKYGKTQVLLHLPLQKEEETIWFQNQVTTFFTENLLAIGVQKKRDAYE